MKEIIGFCKLEESPFSKFQFQLTSVVKGLYWESKTLNEIVGMPSQNGNCVASIWIFISITSIVLVREHVSTFASVTVNFTSTEKKTFI